MIKRKANIKEKFYGTIHKMKENLNKERGEELAVINAFVNWMLF